VCVVETIRRAATGQCDFDHQGMPRARAQAESGLGSKSASVGEIVIAGTGIKGVAHFTQETLMQLRDADLVLYCVADRVTETYLLDLRPDAIDLYVLYDDDKARDLTYIQMAELALAGARCGHKVLMLLYGHAGILANPTSRALRLARAEGIKASMLPAVSSIDCLFADLGVDPGSEPTYIVEATDLLLRRRTIPTDGHVIIMQPGAVGDPGFHYHGSSRPEMTNFLEYLASFYGREHNLVVYQAARFVLDKARVAHVSIAALLGGRAQEVINGISTLYIPPIHRDSKDGGQGNAAAMDESLVIKMRQRYADLDTIHTKRRTQAKAPNQDQDRALQIIPARTRAFGMGYKERQIDAVLALEDFAIPENYTATQPGNALALLLGRMALAESTSCQSSSCLASAGPVSTGDHNLVRGVEERFAAQQQSVHLSLTQHAALVSDDPRVLEAALSSRSPLSLFYTLDIALHVHMDQTDISIGTMASGVQNDPFDGQFKLLWQS
jgi:hypothetical protein